MKTVKLTVNCLNTIYSQEPQESRVVFSIAKKIDDTTYSREYAYFRCKDFFNEIIAARYFGYIYQMVYRFKAKEIYNDKEFFLIFSSPDSDERSNFLSNLKVLKEVEELVGIPIRRRSKILKADDYQSYIIRVPKEWLSSTLMISFYTLLLRSFVYITDSGTLDNHINQMSYLKHNDGCMFKEIKTTKKFNILTFLSNHKVIFKTNPATGYDDNLIKERLLVEPEGSTFRIPKRGNNTDTIYWNYATIHNFGLISFIRALRSIMSHNIGLDWINAYKGLKNAE